ncbi:MAG: lipopolysaccharide heptosyltransferase II [Phycisphaerae bacterium]
MLASLQAAVGVHPRQRILIIKPSALGDVAATLPLLCDLKVLFPESQIDWLINPALADLVRGHDALHELIYFDREKLGPWLTSGPARGNLWTLIQTLRHNQYDIVLDAQGLLRSAVLAWLSGVKIRVGFADAREGARFLYTRRSHIPRGRELAVVRMRSLAAVLAPLRDTVEFRLPVQAAARTKIITLAHTSQPLAAVIPGARWDAKRWSEKGYAQIVRHLADSGLRVLVLGAPRERPLCQWVVEQSQVAALNLAGDTSLAEMIAALDLCRVIIGNDSGPLHVAAALGRPLVGLYGPTDPASVGPFGQMDHVLRFVQPGSYKHSGMENRDATLQSLTVEMVWHKIQTLLEQ